MAAVPQQRPYRHDGHDATIQSRIFLQPIASPSVLGYFALASALIVVGIWLTGNGGPSLKPASFFEFILLFGGVGQLGAALWSYKARDAVSASIHGAWGAFWLGFGLLYLLDTAGTVHVPPPGAHFSPLGMWWMYMAVITWTTAFAALAIGPGGFLAQAILGTGAACLAGAYIVGSPGWMHVGAWLFLAAAFFCFYLGAAMMLDNWFGFTILPQLRWRRDYNIPGARPMRPVELEAADPGVKVGQ